MVVQGRQSIGEIDTQCLQQYALFTGDQWPTLIHPFCDHGDVCAFLLPPLCDLWVTDLPGDLCATVLNMLKINGDHGVHGEVWTSSVPFLNVLCSFNGDLVGFVVEQGRHKGLRPVKKVYYTGIDLQFVLNMIIYCVAIKSKSNKWNKNGINETKLRGNVGSPVLIPITSSCYRMDINSMKHSK